MIEQKEAYKTIKNINEEFLKENKELSNILFDNVNILLKKIKCLEFSLRALTPLIIITYVYLIFIFLKIILIKFQ